MPGARTAATVVWVVCATAFLAALPVAGVAGQEPRPAADQPVAMLRTWAVLASEELRKSGLEDQVLVGLGADSTITLVDREHLDLIARELALGSLLDSSGAGSRRKAGAAVKADALVILNHESIEGKQYVRLVVCETRGGARLRVELIPLEDGKFDEAGKAIVSAIQDVRKHFAQGIKRVYGVPPFVSRCLTHEYDYLQRGYSSLLANALSQQPGVAVIEVEEARQIAREIALTDGQDLQRLVPVFVEGEYQVPVGATGDAEVEFTVRLTAADGDLPKLPVRKVRLSEAARYVASRLPALVLGQEKAGTALDAGQQARVLVERADTFARLGSWDQSTVLREATLLLTDDIGQRQTLVQEYCWIIRANFPSGTQLLSPEHIEECRRRAGLWRAALAHVEYLIRNRQITLNSAPELADRVLGSATTIRSALPNEVVPPMEVDKKRFVREVFPLMRPLDCKPSSSAPGEKDSVWAAIVIKYVMFNYEGNHRLGQDLDFLFYAMTEMLPGDIEPPTSILYMIASPRSYFEGGEESYMDAYLAFLERLEKVDKPVPALLGRLGRLTYRSYQEKTPAELEALAKDVAALADDYKRLQPKLLHSGTSSPPLKQQIFELQRRVERALQGPQGAPKHAPTPTSRPPAAVKLDPIELKIRLIGGEVVPFKGHRWQGPGGWGTVTQVIRCGEVDVFWNHGVILVMRTGGLLEEVLVDANTFFSDVEWDGKQLWVATRTDGIRIIDLTGKVVARIGSQDGLPGADRGMLICTFAPDKAIVAGALGEHRRLWVAMVQREDDKGRVNVFHQATRVLAAGENWVKVPPATDLAGEPRWIHRLDSGKKGGPPTVLLGWGWQRRAMQVDLETLKVSLFGQDLIRADMTRDGDGAHVSRDGRLFEAESGGILLKDGPQIYEFFLGVCRRLDPSKGRFVELGRLPVGREPRLFGTSVHYGMVGWTYDGEFFRLKPADDVKPPASAASNR
jgi:hypothetical protein